MQNGLQKGDREAAIDAEVARLDKLPAHGSYAIHRMKVLNKLRHLLSTKVSSHFPYLLIYERLLLSTMRVLNKLLGILCSSIPIAGYRKCTILSLFMLLQGIKVTTSSSLLGVMENDHCN
jgi:hypothetical protein